MISKEGALWISEIARKLGVPKSSVYYCVKRNFRTKWVVIMKGGLKRVLIVLPERR